MTDRSIRFTKTAIEKLALEALRYEVFDSATPGFGIRVSRTGEKTFFLRYRPKSGAQHRRVTLGRFGEVTLDQARSHALKLKGRIVEGADPNSDREKRKAASTMKDLTERFLRDHVEVHCKASTARNYRSQIRDYVLPRLGRLLASEVDPGHVSKLIATFKDRPYQGNRLRALLSKMFRMAEVWGIRPLGSNPCMGVPKYKESKRHRHLGVDELASIGEALDQAEERGDATSEGVLALRLLLLTGCRRGEILNLRWEHVDLEAGALNLPDSKTGAKRVVLAPPAVALLAEAAGQKLSPWVCPGRDLKLPLVGLPRMWRRILKRAGLERVRIHDLRHTFATYGAGSGLSLPLIGGLLGHSQPATTARYAHAAFDPLREAARQAADPIAKALGLA